MNMSTQVMIISIAAYFISSASIVFIAFIEYENWRFLSMVALAFWLFLIIGSLLFAALPRPVKKNKQPFASRLKILLPAFTFFRNKTAVWIDSVFFAAIAANIVAIFIGIPMAVHLSAIALLVFSFEMHLIFNSKRYECIKILNRKQTGGNEK